MENKIKDFNTFTNSREESLNEGEMFADKKLVKEIDNLEYADPDVFEMGDAIEKQVLSEKRGKISFKLHSDGKDKQEWTLSFEPNISMTFGDYASENIVFINIINSKSQSITFPISKTQILEFAKMITKNI